jgi:transposase-like protein
MKWVEVVIPEVERELYFVRGQIVSRDYHGKYKCQHCGQTIEAKDYKLGVAKRSDFKRDTVLMRRLPSQKRDDVLIFCPNFPACNGTIIDWW